MKYYFENEDSETCYSKSDIIDIGAYEGLNEITVFEAKPVKDKNIFYCQYFMMSCEKSETSCGKSCKGYEPKNGKSGMCKHQGKVFEPTKKVTFKIS